MRWEKIKVTLMLTPAAIKASIAESPALDHRVGPGDLRKQALGLGDRASRVMRKVRRHLKADEAIGAARVTVQGQEDVARLPNVLDGQGLVQPRRIVIGQRGNVHIVQR